MMNILMYIHMGWFFGKIFFLNLSSREILVRQIPYFGMRPFQILGAVGYGEKQVKIPDSGSPLIIKLINKCLSKTRTNRPLFPEIVKLLENYSDKKGT